jgi:acyl-CoA oxidase
VHINIYKLYPINLNSIGFTKDDILTLSQKFWDLHTDPIWCMDGAAGSLVTIQYNLCAGTLAAFADSNHTVRETLERVLTFDIS